MVEGISPIFRNTEDCLELKGEFPKFREAVKLDQKGKKKKNTNEFKGLK